MTIPQPYFSADFWAAQGWTAPWLHDVDPAYRREMIPAICENMIRGKAGWRDFILTPEGRVKMRVQLCTRLSQARESFVPWLEQSRPLGGLNVLEIGAARDRPPPRLPARAHASQSAMKRSQRRRKGTCIAADAACPGMNSISCLGWRR